MTSKSTWAAAGIAILLAACAAPDAAPGNRPAAAQPAAAPAVAAAAATHYFMAMPETGRVWVFGDAKNYLDYVAHGEVQLTRTRIGAGPDGRTLIFGLTNDDVKKNSPSAGEMLYDGKAAVTGPFYGEVFRGGRFLVFGEWADFQDYLKHNEIIFTHTRVGEGPKGETVIYALNKNTVKQGPPTRLIEQFNALRAKK